MSYPIKPNHRYNVSTPLIEGSKTIKIELFQIAQFKSAWSLDTRKNFLPCLPFRLTDRNLFWESEMYRVRVDGLWYMVGGQYVFFTKKEAIERWVL